MSCSRMMSVIQRNKQIVLLDEVNAAKFILTIENIEHLKFIPTPVILHYLKIILYIRKRKFKRQHHLVVKRSKNVSNLRMEVKLISSKGNDKSIKRRFKGLKKNYYHGMNYLIQQMDSSTMVSLSSKFHPWISRSLNWRNI